MFFIVLHFTCEVFKKVKSKVFNLFFKACHFTCKVFEKMKATVFHIVFIVLSFTNEVFGKLKFIVFKFFKEQQLDFYCAAFNVLLEFASATVEQVGNEKNIIYSYVGLGFAVIAFSFAIVEVVWLKKNKKPIAFLEVFGLISTLGQLMASILEIILILYKKEWRLKFSIFSAMFAMSTLAFKVFSKITVLYFINCDYYGKMRMMEVELKNMKSREKVFRCHVCALHDHPNHWNSYWLDSVADDDQKLFNGAGAAHTVEPIDQIGFVFLFFFYLVL